MKKIQLVLTSFLIVVFSVIAGQNILRAESKAAIHPAAGGVEQVKIPPPVNNTLDNKNNISKALEYLAQMEGDDNEPTDEPSSTDKTVYWKLLHATTRGKPWPPGEIVDSEGNFIVVGSVIKSIVPGGKLCVPTSADTAWIVNKDTVPPLINGKEDFSIKVIPDDILRVYVNACQDVDRELDLSEGSPDLDMVLYSNSFGPSKGDFGGGPRIPQLGTEGNTYNLNPNAPTCPDIFPASDQEYQYTRPSYPLHQVPIWGFEGDDLRYDATTGNLKVFSEYRLDQRPRQTPITLGDWMKADKKTLMKIELKDYDTQNQGYTAAQFSFAFKELLPNSIYTLWAVRLATMITPPGREETIMPTPLCIPGVFTTDDKGAAEFSCKAENPFPKIDTLDTTKWTPEQWGRIVFIAISFRSDFQNWGACPSLFGPGVDDHTQLQTRFKDLLNINTVSRSK